MQVLKENDIKVWGEKFISALELTYDEMSMFADIAAPNRSRLGGARQKTA